MKLGVVEAGQWFRYNNKYYLKIDPVKIGGGFFHAYSLGDGKPKFASLTPEPQDIKVVVIDKLHWVQ